jgi:hypothetical protein
MGLLSAVFSYKTSIVIFSCGAFLAGGFGFGIAAIAVVSYVGRRAARLARAMFAMAGWLTLAGNRVFCP